jgi:hypothetical protein
MAPRGPEEGVMIRFAVVLFAISCAIALPQLYAGTPLAWAVGSPPGAPIDNLPKPITAGETKQIESHLRQTLGVKGIRLVPHPPEAEVFIGDRFIGVVYPEEQNGKRAFFFEMAIFDDDLDLDQKQPARSKR